jgi:hypothetical protein
MKNCDKYLIFCCILYIVVIIKSLSLNDYIVYFTIPYFFLVFVVVLILSLVKNIKIIRSIYMALSVLYIIYILFFLIHNFDFIVFVYFIIIIALSVSAKMAFQKCNINIGWGGVFFNFIQICLCVHFFLQYWK